MDKCENCHVKRERDKLLEILKETADCDTCKKLWEEREGCWGKCRECQIKDCPCAGCDNGSKWEWIGVKADED